MAEPSAGPTGAQSTRATVLFCDIVGFTAIAERMGPERAYLIVTGCLTRLDGIARRHGGAVDKFLGDALLAMFGHPVPLENPASAAAGAALEMRRYVEDYNRELALEIPLGVRIGLNTGPVVVGDVRGPVAREFHVLGDTVNVAARLKSRAPVGRIYVGPVTREGARRGFELHPLEEMKLKGREERIVPYELVAPLEGERRAGAGSDPMAFSELVGREAELVTLRACASELSLGRGGIVALIGEEGSGKSRLLAELAAADELAGLSVLRAAPEDADGLADAIRAELAPPGPATPVLVLLDDLHELDPGSARAVERALELVRDAPVLVVLSFRPGGAQSADAVLETARRRHAKRLTELRIPPLDAEQARRLIENVAASPLTDAALALVEARGAGNPRRLILGTFLAPAAQSETERRSERDAGAERRRATILFADITGFTTLTEKLGHERAFPVVDACLQLLDGIARKHGGTVDKHLGDCVLALFGVPEALEDAPRAAVNAAIEMRRQVAAFNVERSLESRLDVHTGINTGLGIAGDISGPLIREFAVMGEAMNVASSLTDLATAGQIYIGPETHRFARDAFELRALEPVQLPGSARPVPVYEVLSDEVQLYRLGVGSGRQVLSALVGRDAELARLEHCLSELRGGQGGVVSLCAAAGIGKSRLVAELENSAAARDVEWRVGRSLSTGRSLSLHPFADLLRHWAAITDDDGEEQIRAKVAALVRRNVPEEADEVFPFVATAMGVRLPPEQEERLARIQGEAKEKRIRASVGALVRGAAEREPLVVVMDDLHWADQSSIELLEALLPLARECGVLFLDVFRPGFGDTSERIRARAGELLGGRHVDIELAPLDRAATRSLINNLFRQGDIPHATRAMIEEKAHGNPFYLEEVVRALVDAGAVEQRGGRFRATAKLRDVTIPGTVHEVIMARVDRLPPSRRRLLQAASVVGQSFHQDVLDELASDANALERDIAELMRAEFIVPSDRMAGVEYAFKHPLIQEVTYDGLLHSTRETLHLEVARAIEARLPTDVPGFEGMLAFHFSKGRDAERAETYLFRAGDAATRLAASSEALHFFREASRLYLELHGNGGDPEKKALLQKKIALALFNRGQLIDAVEHYDAALEHLGARLPRSARARQLGLVRSLARVLAGLYVRDPRRRPRASPVDREVIDLMFERGQCQITADPARFLADSLAMVARLEQLDPRTVPAAGRVFAGSSTIFSYSGLSFGLSRRFLDLARPLLDGEDVAGRFMYGTVNFLHHMLEGDWSAKHQIPEDLVDETLERGHLWDVTTYLGIHGDQRICMGDYATGRRRLEQLARIRDRYDYGLAEQSCHALELWLCLEQGRFEDAVAAADAYYEENPEELMQVQALGSKARAQVFLGDTDGAELTLAACAPLVEKAGRIPPFQLARYRAARALVDTSMLESATRDGDRQRIAAARKRAQDSVKAALRMAPKSALKRTEILRVAGLYRWLTGNSAQALRFWRESADAGQQLGARPDLGRTYLEIGRCLRESGRAPGAQELDPDTCLRAARDIFEELGMEGDLARLPS